MNWKLFVFWLTGWSIIWHNPALAQDTAVGFWKAVTPAYQPYDKKKLDQCFRQVNALPALALTDQDLSHCRGNAGTEPSGTAWNSSISRLRRMGFRECALNKIEERLDRTPLSQLEQKTDWYVQLAFTYLFNIDYYKGDSIAQIAMQLASGLPHPHTGALYITALANYRNLRTEMARQQGNAVLELSRIRRDTFIEMMSLSLLGCIGRDVFIGHNLTAVPDHEKALALATALKDTAGIINELIMLGLNYGDAKQMNRHFDYLSEAMNYLKNFEHIPSRLRIMNVLSTDLSIEGRIQDALLLRQQAVAMAELVQSRYAADFLMRLSGQYIELKQYDKARNALERAHRIFREAGMDKPHQLGGLHEAYYTLEKAVGNKEAALYWLELSYATVSLHYTRRNSELLSRFEAEYKTGEKEKMLREKEVLLQTTKRQRTLVLFFALLVTILGVGVLFGFFKQRMAKLRLSEQNAIILRQSGELKMLEELKSRFFANVSHELRTPLALMLGPVQSLLKRTASHSNSRQMLDYIHRNVLHLQKLINEILDLAKLESGKIDIAEEPVALFPFLQQQIAQFDSFYTHKQLIFDLQYAIGNGETILTDRNKLEKIIQNFLSNAVKFTPEHGKVALSAKCTDSQMEISVSDTGPGIHPDDVQHVFDRFYQSKRIDTGSEGGTGIGLSLCKELALLMGGDVGVHSIPGRGSTFFYRFPLKKVPSNAVVPLAGPTALDIPTAKQVVEADDLEMVQRKENKSTDTPARILIVEDNYDLREYLQFILSSYETRTAIHGKDALTQLFEAERPLPDLIISDLMMPVMDGFELVEAIKSDDRSRHLPMIMLTAKINSQTKLKALRIGVDDYLTKPFNEDELLVRIENLLHNYRQRLEYFSLQHAPDEAATAVARPVISRADAEWLQQVETIFSKNLSESSFNMEWAAAALFVSKRQLDRKLQQLTGLASAAYLREMRLQSAWERLEARHYSSIKEVAFSVGFQDTSHFSSLFHKRFGKLPSAVLH